MQNAQLSLTSTSQSATTFAYPGASVAVSANGVANGIVWAAENALGNSVLHAYDATNLSVELYNSAQASGARDQFGSETKFLPHHRRRQSIHGCNQRSGRVRVAAVAWLFSC